MDPVTNPGTPSTPAVPATPATPAATTTATPAPSQSEKALDAWRSSAPAATTTATAATATPATSAAGATTDPAADAIPDEFASFLAEDLKTADPAAAAAAIAADPNAPDPLAALKDNPRVQELVKAESSLKEAMQLSDYIKEPAHVQDAVRDAHVLWQISDGKVDPSVIFEAARQNNPDSFPALLAKVKSYVEQVTGKPIVAAAAGAEAAALTPEQERLAKVEKELSDRKTREAQADMTERVGKVRTTVTANIGKSLEGTWLEGESDYLFGLVGNVLGPGATMKVVEAAEKGDFGAINKALVAVRGQEARRFHDRIARMKAMQLKKGATIPNQPNGSVSAANAGGESKPIMDQDKRRAAMAEYLKQNPAT